MKTGTGIWHQIHKIPAICGQNPSHPLYISPCRTDEKTSLGIYVYDGWVTSLEQMAATNWLQRAANAVRAFRDSDHPGISLARDILWVVAVVGGYRPSPLSLCRNLAGGGHDRVGEHGSAHERG